MNVNLSVKLIEWNIFEEVFEIPGVEEMPLIDCIDAVVKNYGKEDIIVCRMNEDTNVTILCNKRIMKLTDVVREGDSVVILPPMLGG